MNDLHTRILHLAAQCPEDDPLRVALSQVLADHKTAGAPQVLDIYFEMRGGSFSPTGDSVKASVAYSFTPGTVVDTKVFRAGNIAGVISWLKDQYQAWVAAPGRNPQIRQAATWDSSVLGLTPSDLEDMDADERKDVLRDLLNQAGDLAEAIVAAFGTDLGGNKAEVSKAAKTLQGAARKV